jgi:acetyltransferase-like isoleucine patch superfamily enzyme
MDHADIANSFLGIGSYIGPECVIPNAYIGRYCSISGKVRTIWGKHPSRTFVSTNPIFYNTNNKLPLGKSTAVFDECSRTADGKSIHIGNDVWIGYNVSLKQGVTIGDGAIIGMNAVVVKDVKPYEIVGGNPATLIRLRFSQEQIAELLKISWWNWPVETVRERRDDFANIESFVVKYRPIK